MVQLKEHLAGFGHQKNSFVLTIGKFLQAQGGWVAIAKIHLPASLRRDLRGERDLGAAFLDAVLERAEAAYMGGMSQHAPRHVFEFVPLFHKIIPAVIAN